jgi:hypothetical protein
LPQLSAFIQRESRVIVIVVMIIMHFMVIVMMIIMVAINNTAGKIDRGVGGENQCDYRVSF